jgi:hypothetical protein
MKCECEICRLINKLGLPQTEHDLWFCPCQGRQIVEDSLISAIAA